MAGLERKFQQSLGEAKRGAQAELEQVRVFYETQLEVVLTFHLSKLDRLYVITYDALRRDPEPVLRQASETFPCALRT